MNDQKENNKYLKQDEKELLEYLQSQLIVTKDGLRRLKRPEELPDDPTPDDED